MRATVVENIRTKPAARDVISNRQGLAALLGCEADFIAAVALEPKRYYTEFAIPKRNGELRPIKPPCKALRIVQRSLLGRVYQRVRIPPWMHGGVPKKSILTHARAHVGKTMVFTLDVRKFFPSTSAGHIAPVLAALGFVEEAAEDVISLVMLENSLPQGAPTSSMLANLAFAPSDTLFFEFCHRHGLFYSRYVDDIAISGDRDFASLKGTFIGFIRASGYDVAGDEKVNPMPRGSRQVVTGLVVNEKLRPTSTYIGDLKHEIRLCLERGAYEVALSEGTTIAGLKNRLTGQACHVQSVDPKLGKKLRGLLCGIEWRKPRVATAS